MVVGRVARVEHSFKVKNTILIDHSKIQLSHLVANSRNPPKGGEREKKESKGRIIPMI